MAEKTASPEQIDTLIAHLFVELRRVAEAIRYLQRVREEMKAR